MPNDPCGGSGAPSGQSAGVACPAYENLAADAAAHLARSGHTAEGFVGGPEEIDRQAACLVEWARQRAAVLSDDYTTGLKQHEGTTAEHVVYYRGADDRAVKKTYSGTFGVTPDPKGEQKAATPAFYLQRLDLMNQVFQSDFRLEGIAFGKSLILFDRTVKPCMVVSQPWIRAADPNQPHPTKDEIAEFMESLGFSEDSKGYYAWNRWEDGVRVIDARPDNFVKSPDGVVPIDLVISLAKPAEISVQEGKPAEPPVQ